MSTEPQPKKQKRFTAQRKQEVVLRLLKGEPIELLSRELSVPAATLSEWRETFLTSALNGLKSKPEELQRSRRSSQQVVLLERATVKYELDCAFKASKQRKSVCVA